MDPIRTGQEVITPVTKAIIEDIQLLKESQMHHPCISFHISKKVRYIEWMINLTSSVLSHDICFKDMIGSVSPSNLVISRQYHLKFIFHRDINRVSIMLCGQTTACLPLSTYLQATTAQEDLGLTCACGLTRIQSLAFG